MFCKKCGGDKFKVEEVTKMRGKRFTADKGWAVNDEYDTREIRCLSCNTIYLQESKIIAVSVFSPSKLRSYRIPIDEWKPDVIKIANNQGDMFQ